MGFCTSYVQKTKTYQKINLTHFVFPHFSRLTVRIEHFRLENRIPREKLHIVFCDKTTKTDCFTNCWPLGFRIVVFCPENQIPGEKLHMLTAGHV